jgi:hypothetical protein
MISCKTRAEALKAGLKKYYTGVPCKFNHVSFRYTTTGACVDCVSGHGRKHRWLNYKGPHTVRLGVLDLRDIPLIKAFVDAVNLDRKAENDKM